MKKKNAKAEVTQTNAPGHKQLRSMFIVPASTGNAKFADLPLLAGFRLKQSDEVYIKVGERTAISLTARAKPGETKLKYKFKSKEPCSIMSIRISVGLGVNLEVQLLKEMASKQASYVNSAQGRDGDNPSEDLTKPPVAPPAPEVPVVPAARKRGPKPKVVATPGVTQPVLKGKARK